MTAKSRQGRSTGKRARKSSTAQTKARNQQRAVDEIQRELADSVFGHTKDAKKAAGRALGTFVEIITYYLLREWGLGPQLSLELPLPEFGNAEIAHNVEFGVHPLLSRRLEAFEPKSLPLSVSKLRRSSAWLHAALSEAETNRERKAQTSSQLLSADHLRCNAMVLVQTKSRAPVLTADLVSWDGVTAQVAFSEIHPSPFAIVECKRVGIEDGQKKGPTTIEKAKQGAYVALKASALQKVRDAEGQLWGVFAKPEGGFDISPHADALAALLAPDAKVEDLGEFVLTVGVTSNHGNWFTADDPNKELRVLKQSYDWLLFLSDAGLAEFTTELVSRKGPVREAFALSYGSGKESNRLTKKRLSQAAHDQLLAFFKKNAARVQRDWFTVLGPAGRSVSDLKSQLTALAGKSW